VKRIVLPVLLLLVLVGAWELYVDLGGVDSLVWPSPHQVAKSLWVDRGLLWHSFLITSREVVLGILAAALAGFALAVAIHLSQTTRRAVYPLVIASQAVPVPIMAPLLVFWLGFGILPKLVVVAIVSFFAIVVGTLDGLATVDPQLLKLMRTLDATRLRTFRHVELPAALPGVFTGAKIAVAVSVIGAVLAEQAPGSSGGLGFQIELSQNQLLPARGVAIVVILSVAAVALFGLLSLAERFFAPWAYQVKGERSR